MNKEKIHNQSVQALLLLLILNFDSVNCQIKEQIKTNEKIASEIKKNLDNDFSLWYPLCIDTAYGGFFSDINYKWQLEGTQNKMIVSQARHIWSTSNAFLFFSNGPELIQTAEHGFKFLRDVMWDKEFGGFYDLVNREGKPLPEAGQIIKKAYGNSFAIYGLAAFYKATGNKQALELAKKTFYWLEKFSHDKQHGGYFQFLSRNGNVHQSRFQHYPPKDQNSSIHLLECFTELYKVWPDSLLGDRLISLLRIIRDTITHQDGYMRLFFSRDWNPISYRDSFPEVRNKNYEIDHVSSGHDIETAYLMLEASELINAEDHLLTLSKAKKMVDHTIKFGWDNELGGIYDGGYYFNNEKEPRIIKSTKEWWAQAEALNSLLLMSTIYPNEKKYSEYFYKQWEYIKKYMIDSKFGGWYWGGIDQVPENKFASKGSIWKVNYHTSRSLINCLRLINERTDN